MAGAKGKKKIIEESESEDKITKEDCFDDFLETYEDDSKFGGKSLSSPIKSIEVQQLALNSSFFNAYIIFLG